MNARRTLLPLALLSGLMLALPTSATASVWPMLGGSLRHPSTSTFLGPSTNALAWRFTTNAAIDGGVAIDSDGAVFVGTANGRFHALESNGQERWSKKNLSPVIGVPAIGHDGRVFVGANSGTAGSLYAFDRHSGDGGVLFTTDSPLVGSPAIDRSGTILLATRAKGIFAVTPSGTLLWKSAVGKIEASSPAVGADGAIYVGTADGRLVALEGNGSTRWSKSIASKTTILTSPAIGSDGRIYVAADDGRVRALDTTGAVLWTFIAQAAVRAGVSLGPDGTIYFGADDRKAYHLSSAGALLWAVSLGGAVRSTPVIDRDGGAYIGADDQRVHALAGDDGQERWSFKTAGSVRSALAIGVGGRLFVGSNDKTVYALGEFRTGAECWSDAFIDPEGLTQEEADRRFQILLAACGGVDVGSCEAEVQGAVNADRVAAAYRISTSTIDPAEYLAILRDRTAKLAALRSGAGGGLCAVAAADADHDLVPDSLDLCPGTPLLTPTLANGCPDPTRPEAPSADLVHQFLDHFGFALDPHCDDSSPATSIFLQLGESVDPEGSFIIVVTDSNDQPPECGSWYEIEAFVPNADGTFEEFYMVFKRSQADPTSVPGTLEFHISNGDPAPYGAFASRLLLLPRHGDSGIRFRVRVTTFRGVRSVWSSL